jgi:hypothetical protein
VGDCCRRDDDKRCQEDRDDLLPGVPRQCSDPRKSSRRSISKWQAALGITFPTALLMRADEVIE